MHEFFFENLRNPARNRRADLMRQFRSGQLVSTRVDARARDVRSKSRVLHGCLVPRYCSFEAVYTRVYTAVLPWTIDSKQYLF